MEVTGRRLSRDRLPQHARPSSSSTGPTPFAGSWFASTPVKLSRPASASVLRTPPRGYLARPPVSPERLFSYERPQSAPLRRQPVSPPAAKTRTLGASPDAHMFLSTGSLQSDSRRNLALQPVPDPASLHFRARAQLQEAAAMMWGEVGAPWLYLEKAAEVSELLLQNNGLQPAERQILLKQRALLASTHAHLATSLQLWKSLEGMAAKLTAATGQSAAHAPGGPHLTTDHFTTSPATSPTRPTSATSATRPASATSPTRLKRWPADAPQSPLTPPEAVASTEEGGPRGDAATGSLGLEGGVEEAAAEVQSPPPSPPQQQLQQQQLQQQQLQQQQLQQQQQLDAAGRRLAHLRRWLTQRPPSTADGQTQANSPEVSREASQHSPKAAASPPEGGRGALPEAHGSMHPRSLDLDGAARVLSPSEADRPPSPPVSEPEAHHDDSLGSKAAQPQNSAPAATADIN